MKIRFIKFSKNIILHYIASIILGLFVISVLVVVWTEVSKNPWVFLVVTAILVAILVLTGVISFETVKSSLEKRLRP